MNQADSMKSLNLDSLQKHQLRDLVKMKATRAPWPRDSESVGLRQVLGIYFSKSSPSDSKDKIFTHSVSEDMSREKIVHVKFTTWARG